MAPSFYDPASWTPSLFTSNVARQSMSASGNSLPSLAVVLGLIGVLVALILVAGICIYIFRGRLFPKLGQVDEEKTNSQTKRSTTDLDQSSYFSAIADSRKASLYEAGDPGMKRPALRPFLLNPATPVTSCEELPLSRLQRQRSYQVINLHSRYTATKHQIAGFAYVNRSTAAVRNRNLTLSGSLKASQSCPARLGQEKCTSCNAIPPEDDKVSFHAAFDENYALPFSSSHSSDSTSSIYSEESKYSSSTDSLNWDYYINDLHESLFYESEPTLPSTSSSSYKIGTSKRLKVRHRSLFKHRTSSIAAHQRRAYSYKAKSRVVLNAVRRHNLFLGAARYASARSISADVPCTDYSPSSSLQARSNPFYNTGYAMESGLPTANTIEYRNSPVELSDIYLMQTPPRTSSRNPFSNVTNILGAPGASQSSIKPKPSTPPSARPSLFINDSPADDLTTMSPPRFKRLRSPPRNPALLNTRWIPRPATPPLKITVFAKNRSFPASTYPGRRVELTPPAGTSLAELRGSVERALGHDIRSLRGMVFVGSRSMFLPLVSERFYAQWVKERIRDGGVGVVEAWSH